MGQRISIKDLERLCNIINSKFEEKQKIRTDGKFNIGTFYIDQGNGGVNLYRVSNEGGAVSEPICYGHTSKKELYAQMIGFVRLHDMMISEGK